MTEDQQEQAPTPQLWVRSDRVQGPDGYGYRVVLNYGDDWARPLEPEEAHEYAFSVIMAATAAEHDAAVWSLMRHAGVSDDAAAQLVMRVREGRPDFGLSGELTYQTGLNAEGAPFVLLLHKGRPAGQLDTPDLREHGAAVLSCLAAVALDTRLATVLDVEVDIDGGTIATMVDALGQHWPEAGVF